MNNQETYLLKLKSSGQRKIVSFPEIDRVKKNLSLTRPHSRICIRIYIFNFKKQQQQQKKIKKAKETKEDNIFGKSIKENKFAAALLKIFLVTRISENKSFFGLSEQFCKEVHGFEKPYQKNN